MYYNEMPIGTEEILEEEDPSEIAPRWDVGAEYTTMHTRDRMSESIESLGRRQHSIDENTPLTSRCNGKNKYGTR